MAKTLTKKPKVGDILTLIGRPKDIDLTQGKDYEVVGYDDEGDPFFFDDAGNPEYVLPPTYGNYTLTEFEDTDPGSITVDIRRPMDNTGTMLLEVTADQKGYDTLMKIQAQHTKSKKRKEIMDKIKALQAELDTI